MPPAIFLDQHSRYARPAFAPRPSPPIGPGPCLPGARRYVQCVTEAQCTCSTVNSDFCNDPRFQGFRAFVAGASVVNSNCWVFIAAQFAMPTPAGPGVTTRIAPPLTHKARMHVELEHPYTYCWNMDVNFAWDLHFDNHFSGCIYMPQLMPEHTGQSLEWGQGRDLSLDCVPRGSAGLVLPGFLDRGGVAMSKLKRE